MSLEAPPLHVRHLGIIPYTEALLEQRRLHSARVAGDIPDTLLLLQHPHVFTLGRSSDPRHILVQDTFLKAQGATVERIERGGEVTYHGPGQLVAYPILFLQQHERSITRLVDRLEETLLRTLHIYHLHAQLLPPERGVWVNARKIASIGLAVRKWTTMHGIALNVDPDMRYFTFINPCGHPEITMTSMASELGVAPDLSAVAQVFAEQFALVFGRIRREE